MRWRWLRSQRWWGVRALGQSMTRILNFSFGLLLEPYDTRWPMNMGRKLFAKVMEYVP